MSQAHIKSAFLSLRLPPDVKEALSRLAQENTRTVGAQALHYIRLGLKKDLQGEHNNV
jgi:hypothetical protein